MKKLLIGLMSTTALGTTLWFMVPEAGDRRYAVWPE